MRRDRDRIRCHDAGRGHAGLVVVAVAVGFVVGACTSAPAADADPATYRAEVNRICRDSLSDQGALTQPDDSAGVATFALAVAEALAAEADLMRAVAAPETLAADHRALIQNTDDQARRWTTLSTTPPDDTAAFGEVRTELLQLALGRDDLAEEMGLTECRRSDG